MRLCWNKKLRLVWGARSISIFLRQQTVAIRPAFIEHFIVQTTFLASPAQTITKSSRAVLIILLLALAFVSKVTFASSIIPLSTAEHVAASAAVFRGVVVGQDCFRDVADGLIYTRTSLRVIEALKGTFPTIIAVVHRGGAIGEERQFYGNSPLFAHSEERLVFVVRRADGKLTGTQGSFSAMKLIRTNGTLAADQEALLNEIRALTGLGTTPGENVTDQNGFASSSLVTGLLVDGAGISSRFIQSDRGEPIPVLIDASALPVGITLAQATNAVLQALNAWSAVTKLKFNIEAIQSFGAGADTITTSDEKLRIQLHDTYNSINSVGTLGIGGRGSLSVPIGTWDLGGAVGTNEFYKTAYGYVVLEHGSATMQNLASFTEVLCHEIGHALSMAHSSETFPQPNNTLFQSIMYFQIHGDGRGATLGAYDPPVIQQAYPLNNTPPFILNPFPAHRVIDGTTASTSLSLTGINEVEIRGYDLQSQSLTVVTNNESGTSGNFSLVGNLIKYSAVVGNFSDTTRIDPQVDIGVSYSFYRRIFARLSDGTNSSPYTVVRVISLCRDGIAPPDGLPNYWMANYFGSTTPAAGNLSRVSDDADGDGFTNLQEYRMGTNPKATNSLLRINSFNGNSIQFSAQAYELYEIQGSTNLTNWSYVTAITPSTNSLAFRTTLPQTNILVTVSNLSVNSPKMFYRVRKVP